MSKSNQPDKKSLSQPDLPCLIKLDEGLFGSRISERISPEMIEHQLQNFLQKLEDFRMVIEEDETWDGEDYDDYEYEDVDFAELEPKIISILSSQKIKVNWLNLQKYLAYLNKSIQTPCILTGNQEFEWEEYYIFGPGTPKQHEKQRKINASYMDRFQLIDLVKEVSESQGIMAEVERLSDKKVFTLPLCQLEEAEPITANYELIDTYVTWFENYQD
ncbi:MULTISPECIES: hypothetical protein [Planktothricoides]|uniref:Uncharacterized protein n=2 Tax=Planktothricoides raciborskii TaxID=132608 RepID=A0AAU8JHC8_9CYAN|nr:MULTISPECIES: hypothetical protein [Planktothricoides]MBD2545610.1 hypothetical protein [Planktothricoides raciborskii FACHB-1370]MBD2584922.1 hypothetical protein [Planktothricoides raciborskii FACHB-1261]